MLGLTLTGLIKLAAPFIAAGLAWAGHRVVALLGAKTKSEEIHAALALLDQAIDVAVKRVSQTQRPSGSLDPETRARLKKLAMESVWRVLGVKWSRILCRLLGLSEPDLDNLISDRIEARIYELKSRS